MFVPLGVLLGRSWAKYRPRGPTPGHALSRGSHCQDGELCPEDEVLSDRTSRREGRLENLLRLGFEVNTTALLTWCLQAFVKG